MNKDNKQYIRPSMKVIQLQHHPALLAFSDGQNAGARQRSNWDETDADN